MPEVAKIRRRLSKFDWIFKPLVYLAAITAIFLIFWRLWPAIKAGANWFNPAITQMEAFKGRTNILLLGIGGEGHEGADLTDSMMLISVNLTSADTVIISLPRDIWVESLAAKLNTAYHYGEARQAGGGLILAKAAVAEVTNQPVHYALVLDFSGFERAIDILGGLNIDVPRGFIDKQYPLPGKEAAEPESARYETVEFSAGRQLMGGEMALKYVRSRHAEGEEGTDYSRAQRQQRVILAFKDRLLKPSTWLNFTKMKQLKQALLTSVKTDLPEIVYPDLVKLGLKIDQSQIRTGVLDQGSFSEDIPPLLYNPPVSRFGQWVLLPAGDDWNRVFQYVEEIFYQNQLVKE